MAQPAAGDDSYASRTRCLQPLSNGPECVAVHPSTSKHWSPSGSKSLSTNIRWTGVWNISQGCRPSVIVTIQNPGQPSAAGRRGKAPSPEQQSRLYGREECRRLLAASHANQSWTRSTAKANAATPNPINHCTRTTSARRQHISVRQATAS